MRTAPDLSTRDTPLAIATICAGVGFLVANDAVAKVLTDHYSPIQIVFVRNLIAAPIIAALIIATIGTAGLRTRHPGLHALRGGVMLLAATMYFTALSLMPLAEATALIFSAPLFITALSVPLLGEAVGWRRWGAVLLGFAGVLVIVRPGSEAFQLAALLPVGAAICYAFFMLSARWLNRDEGWWTMMLMVMVFPAIYAAPFALADWTPLRMADAGLFIAIAAFGSLGITLIGQAFRMAPAAIVAPFDYTALLWATGLGWLIWGDIPTLWTLIGALIIAASGVMIILREARAESPPR